MGNKESEVEGGVSWYFWPRGGCRTSRTLDIKRKRNQGEKKYRNDNGKHTQWKWEVKQFDCLKCCRQTWRKKKNVYITWVCVWCYKKNKKNKKWMPPKTINVQVKELFHQLFFLSADQQRVFGLLVCSSVTWLPDWFGSVPTHRPSQLLLLFVSSLIFLFF